MAICKLGEKGCWKDGKCHYSQDCENKVLTNADRIRAMGDKELADWLARTQISNVAEALKVAKIPYEQTEGLKNEVTKECLEWLKQPAEETNER